MLRDMLYYDKKKKKKSLNIYAYSSSKNIQNSACVLREHTKQFFFFIPRRSKYYVK